MGAFSQQNTNPDDSEFDIINNTPVFVDEEELVELVNTELRSEYQTKLSDFQHMMTAIQNVLNEHQVGAGNGQCFTKLLAGVTITLVNLSLREQNILLDEKIDKIDHLKQRFLTSLM